MNLRFIRSSICLLSAVVAGLCCTPVRAQTNAEWFFNAASSNVLIGDYVAALTNLTKAIELNPRFAEAYVNRSAVKGFTQDIDCAIDHLSKPISSNPRLAEAYCGRGIVTFNLHRAAALADFNKAIELNPKLAPPHYWRGLAEVGIRNFKGGIAAFSKAIELNPHFWEAYDGRGNTK